MSEHRENVEIKTQLWLNMTKLQREAARVEIKYVVFLVEAALPVDQQIVAEQSLRRLHQLKEESNHRMDDWGPLKRELNKVHDPSSQLQQELVKVHGHENSSGEESLLRDTIRSAIKQISR